MAYVKEFNSIIQFYRYLCNTPFNKAFEDYPRSSENTDKSRIRFTKTSSFEEAVDLLLNGWEDAAIKLSQDIKVSLKQPVQAKAKNVLSVSGYQPIVPLYLLGVPTDMLDRRMVNIKSKVITITKLVSYPSAVEAEEIEEESLKAVSVINKLESMGYRVNLNVAFGSFEDITIVCKVKIKNANERLNISKLAFPLIHPSMLRRLFFRYVEVCPEATREFRDGYGTPCNVHMMKEYLKDDIILPAIWNTDIKEIGNLDDLIAKT